MINSPGAHLVIKTLVFFYAPNYKSYNILGVKAKALEIYILCCNL